MDTKKKRLSRLVGLIWLLSCLLCFYIGQAGYHLFWETGTLFMILGLMYFFYLHHPHLPHHHKEPQPETAADRMEEEDEEEKLS